MAKAKEGEGRGRLDAERGFPEESKYPQEVIHNTLGGIKFKYGNEKDKEYIQILHPMGTSMTIWPDGKMETFVRGESRTYIKGGSTVTVDGNSDTTVDGHSKSHMGGGVHIEVTGDAGIVCGGSVAVSALSGSLGLQVKDMYIGCSGDLNMNVGGSTNIKTKGDTFIGSGGGITNQAGSVSLNPKGGASGYS